MNKIQENIKRQFKRWLNNQKKSQSYKDYDSKEYDAFAHGYATGWIKALQAFKGWLAEFGEDSIIETEVKRMKELLNSNYACIGDDEKKCKREAYDEILSVIEYVKQS